MKKDRKDTVLVVGCGRFGSTVANRLSEKNNNVTIIDIDQSNFRKLSPSYGGLTKEGDGGDIDVLESVDIEKTDIVIVATDDDDTNIMVGAIVKDIYKVDEVVVRLFDPSKDVCLSRSGVKVIYPAVLSYNEFERLAYGEEE